MEQPVKNELAMTKRNAHKRPEKLKLVFAKNLNFLLDKHGMSQSDLARRIGVKPQSVQGWASARSLPRGQTLLKLSKVLGIKPGDMMQEISITTDADKPKQPKRAIRSRLIDILNSLEDTTNSAIKFNLDSATDTAVITSENGTAIIIMTDDCSRAASAFNTLLMHLAHDLEQKQHRRYLLIALPPSDVESKKFIRDCQQLDPTHSFKKALTQLSSDISADYIDQIMDFEYHSVETALTAAVDILDTPVTFE